MQEHVKKYLSLCCFLFSAVSHATTIQVNAPLPEPIEDGLCSIAEAITAANTDQSVDGCEAGQGADFIQLEERQYTVSKVNNMTNGSNGLPVIRSYITIQGVANNNEDRFQRSATVIVRDRPIAVDYLPSLSDKNTPFRFFVVEEDGVLTLKDLMLSSGYASSSSAFSESSEVLNSIENKGGAILNFGELNLEHVSLSGNTAVSSGGAIYSTGHVMLSDNSVLDSNHAVLLGGGAVDAQGVLTIRKSLLGGNSAELGGAVRFTAAENQTDAFLLAMNSIFSGNHATQGGAIFIDSKTKLDFIHTTIHQNKATETGGGIYIQAKDDDLHSSVRFANSLIAENTPVDCRFETTNTVLGKGNWFGDSSCQTLASGNPELFNHMRLLFFSSTIVPDNLISAYSAIIDAADEDRCSNPLIAEDILGNPRSVDGDGLNGEQCDIGAIEWQGSTAMSVFEDHVTRIPPRSGEFGGFSFLRAVNASHRWREYVIEPQQDDQYADLVFTSPPSFQGAEPGVIRLHTIAGCCTAIGRLYLSPLPPTRSRLTIRFQEYTYQDQFHVSEQVSILGARPGIQRSESGEVIVLNSFELSGTGQWKTIRTPMMGGIPHVFLSTQTANGGQAASVRVRNVTESSFEAALFEEETLMRSGHATEEIAYLLIQNPKNSGVLQLPDQEVPYQLQQIELNHQWQSVFDVELMLQEEQSRDPELRHVKELVDVIKIGEHVFAQQVSSRGTDSASIRLRR